MAMIFEDAFVDAQSSAVSLCLEFLEIARANPEKIYIYMYTEDGSYMFNTFFQMNNRILLPNALSDPQGVRELLKCGAEDCQNILQVCKQYKRDCPCEIRMVFETASHKFDAEYRYEPLGEGEYPAFRFLDWRNEVQKGLEP